MFTGIVDHCGKITSIEKKSDSILLSIESLFQDVVQGESIAVDGICLTALDPFAGKFHFDLSQETCQCTRAMHYASGDSINLERALQVTDRLSGHFVMGHVDQVLCVKEIKNINEFQSITFDGIQEENKSFIFKKGSVAINGVSLTINSVSDHSFEVMLIPHTLERTNLKYLKNGDVVNVEFDWLAKIVARQCEVKTNEK